MKIAHFETSMDWGGQELRIVEQTEWLNQHGHPTWIVARPGAAIIKKAREKTCPHLNCACEVRYIRAP